MVTFCHHILGRTAHDGARQRQTISGLAEQAFAPIDGAKQLLSLGHTFRAPQEQVTLAYQPEVEGLKHLGLQRRIEVDQNIAAGHKVLAQERRVADEVMPRKDDQVTQKLARLESMAYGFKKPLKQVRGDFGHGSRRIDTSARHIERIVVDVGRKNLQTVLRKFLPQCLGKQHGNRVGLFPAGTASRPDSNFTTWRLTVANFLNRALEYLESITITKKSRH